MHNSAHPKCLLCGGVDSPVHRCPREHTCIDCMLPADVFVPNPDALALGEAELLEEAAPTYAQDKPLCDRCLCRRIRQQSRQRSN